MNTWNSLPFPYRKKVYNFIGAAVNDLILREKGVNSTLAAPVNTRGIAINKAAIEALLRELKIQKPVYTTFDIPFNVENGIDDNGNENAARMRMATRIATMTPTKKRMTFAVPGGALSDAGAIQLDGDEHEEEEEEEKIRWQWRE